MKCPLNVALAAAAVIWGVILAAGTAGQALGLDPEPGKAELETVTTAGVR